MQEELSECIDRSMVILRIILESVSFDLLAAADEPVSTAPNFINRSRSRADFAAFSYVPIMNIGTSLKTCQEGIA